MQDAAARLSLSDDETLDGVTRWFGQFGPADPNYLAVHYNRFIDARTFALEGRHGRLNILDIGAHWLHNAFFYANRDHELTCVDSPDCLTYDPVKRAAEAMRAKLKT